MLKICLLFFNRCKVSMFDGITYHTVVRHRKVAHKTVKAISTLLWILSTTAMFLEFLLCLIADQFVKCLSKSERMNWIN